MEDTATDLRAPLNAADEEASCAPEDCTPEGYASVNGPALAVAKGPVSPRGMTPMTMASSRGARQGLVSGRAKGASRPLPGAGDVGPAPPSGQDPADDPGSAAMP